MSVVLAPQYTRREYRWTAWKGVHAVKTFVYQCDDDGIAYTIWGYDGPEVYVCQIFKESVPENALTTYSQNQNDQDKSDFETNYLSNANKVIDTKTISGATTNTPIGNTGDSLKTSIVPNSSGIIGHIDLERYLKDAFGRLRVSQPATIFDCNFIEDELNHLIYSKVTSGGAVTWNSNISSTDLSVTTTTNSRAIVQTSRYIPYHPGKSQLVKITGNMGGSVDGVTKYFGQFDQNNGVYFCTENLNPCVGLRSKVTGSVVDTHIVQSDWNVDKFDGTGPSGITIDFSKQQIFIIDYQWQGSGQIRFGFSLQDHVYYCHIMNHANAISTPYSQTATLPIRAEIVNTANSSSSMHITCLVVESEGGWGPEGELRTMNTGYSNAVSLSTIGTRKPIISLRKKTNEYKIPTTILEAGTFISSADDILLELVLGGTLTGASWGDVTGACQKDTSSTAISGGRVVYSIYIRGSSTSSSIADRDFSKLSNDFFIGSDVDGDSEIFSVVATNITSTASVHGYINYKEII